MGDTRMEVGFAYQVSCYLPCLGYARNQSKQSEQGTKENGDSSAHINCTRYELP